MYNTYVYVYITPAHPMCGTGHIPESHSICVPVTLMISGPLTEDSCSVSGTTDTKLYLSVDGGHTSTEQPHTRIGQLDNLDRFTWKDHTVQSEEWIEWKHDNQPVSGIL